MSNQKLDQLIEQVENYVECWKQFNNFANLARSKKFSQEDENQFLETKSVLVQELELILASVEVVSPTREEIHALLGDAPSLRYVSQMNEGALRNQESQWHRIYISWHSILGQLKVRQRGETSRASIGSVFRKKKK
jgi:oligoendopeptidase F